jgi:hypothetical protein
MGSPNFRGLVPVEALTGSTLQLGSVTTNAVQGKARLATLRLVAWAVPTLATTSDLYSPSLQLQRVLDEAQLLAAARGTFEEAGAEAGPTVALAGPPTGFVSTPLTVPAVVLQELARVASTEVALPSTAPCIQLDGTPYYFGAVSVSSLASMVAVLETAVHVMFAAVQATGVYFVETDALSLLLSSLQYVGTLLGTQVCVGSVADMQSQVQQLASLLLFVIPNALRAQLWWPESVGEAPALQLCVDTFMAGLWLFVPDADAGRALLDAALVAQAAMTAGPGALAGGALPRFQNLVPCELMVALAGLLTNAEEDSGPVPFSAAKGGAALNATAARVFSSGNVLFVGSGLDALLSELARRSAEESTAAARAAGSGASVARVAPSPVLTPTLRLLSACQRCLLVRLGPDAKDGAAALQLLWHVERSLRASVDLLSETSATLTLSPSDVSQLCRRMFESLKSSLLCVTLPPLLLRFLGIVRGCDNPSNILQTGDVILSLIEVRKPLSQLIMPVVVLLLSEFLL